MKLTVSFFLFIYLHLFSMAAWSHGSQPDIRFERIVPQHRNKSILRCNSVAQDETGYLWLATYNGLLRYNGYNFSVFQHHPERPDSLSDNSVMTLFVDKQGILWIGTDKGLNRFNRRDETFTRFLHDPLDPQSLSNNRVRVIREDDSGNLWIGTYGGGLNKYDRKDKTFSTFRNEFRTTHHIPGDSVWALCISRYRPGTLWVGVYGGLCKFALGTETFFPLEYDSEHSQKLAQTLIRIIFEDSRGVLWIGTDGQGLFRFSERNGSFREQKLVPGNWDADPDKSYITSICEDSDGQIWIGTHGGLYRLQPDGRQSGHFFSDVQDEESLSHDTVLSIFRDRSGIMWIGTVGGGLNKVIRNRFPTGHHILLANRATRPAITCIYQDYLGCLWIGSREGLIQADSRTGIVKRIFKNRTGNGSSISHDHITSICEDHEERLWIGTHGGGLNRFDRESQTFTRYTANRRKGESLVDNRITAIVMGTNHTLWIGTRRKGLQALDTRSGKFIHFKHEPNNPNSLSDDQVLALYRDRQDALWIAVLYWGFDKFEPARGKWTHFLNYGYKAGQGSTPTIQSITQDRRGDLWFASTKGLLRLHKEQGKLTTYTTRNGLPCDHINGVMEDNSRYIWISCHQGLARFDPHSETVICFGRKEGLTNTFNTPGACFKNPEGRMFFGSDSGIVHFFHDDIKTCTYIPPVVLTGFNKFGKPAETGRPVTGIREVYLSTEDRSVSFEFAALSFFEPRKNQYRFKLEGRDEEWTYLGHKRIVNLRQLKSGRYRLKVRASNHDGLWNSAGFTLDIRVRPPFWKTVWFGGLLSIFILLSTTVIVMGVRRRNVRLIMQDSISLESLSLKYNISKREQEIIHLVIRGKSNREIEDELFISYNTVKNHMYNIYKKTGVKNRLELVKLVSQFSNQNHSNSTADAN